ncbi:hypothetical protein WL77_19200 [Burkholderia ubonensis]|nr:hypothetical protein WL77_19200 [Burkholderia ubonensis]KWE76898.1 hypothetical protein WL79_08625 [Burkholderia ubonensis]
MQEAAGLQRAGGLAVCLRNLVGGAAVSRKFVADLASAVVKSATFEQRVGIDTKAMRRDYAL